MPRGRASIFPLAVVGLVIGGLISASEGGIGILEGMLIGATTGAVIALLIQLIRAISRRGQSTESGD